MTNEHFWEYNMLGNNHVDVLFSLPFPPMNVQRCFKSTLCGLFRCIKWCLLPTFMLMYLLSKHLQNIINSGQIANDPTSYLNLSIFVFSVLNFSPENICLWLQRNLDQNEGHCNTGLNQPKCVGCVKELSNYSRTHGSFYPLCCFLALSSEVNSKPWSSRRGFLMCCFICSMNLSSTLK